MKNFILLLLMTFFSSLVYGQAISVRYITAKKGENSQLRDALKIKTQKYNTKDNQPKIYTFAVRASQKGKLSSYVRLTYATTLGELSVGGSGQPGMMDYWMKNVDVHINSSSSNEIFTLRKSATYNDAVGTDKPMRRVFHYNIKHGEQHNFWRIRDNLPKAIEKSGVDLDINSFNSFAGGSRQHARIVIFGKNLASFEPGSGNWSKIKDAYNEIYGNNSWEEDWELHHKSLLNGAYGNGWGNSVELLEFIPELSSPLLDK